MQQNEMDEWNRSDFRDWLDAQEPLAEVGTSDSCDDCPLARWRSSLEELVSVSADTVVLLSSDRREFPTPSWATDFIDEIDRKHSNENEYEEGEDDIDYRQEPVYAHECLDALDAL